MPEPRILSIGSINLDVQVRAPGWPERGGAGLASDCRLAGGGKAANVAYLARRLGVPAQLIGGVGDDPMVGRLLELLRGVDADLSEVLATPGCLTGVALIMTPPDGKKLILLAPNANRAWEAEDAPRVAATVRRAPAGSIVVVDFEITVDVAAAAVEAAHVAGLRVIVDPAPASDVPPSSLSQADYVTPDAEEARQLTGITARDADNALAAARALRDRGVRTAIVKRSGGGCAVVGPDVTASIEPEPVKAIDTNGAGDAFAATLAVALLEGRSILDAARHAVAAAGLTTTRYGAQASFPDRRELEEHATRINTRP
jgi:ribokinase